MSSSWKLGSAFGIGIFVHWTFLLLPAYLLLTGWASGSAEDLLFLLTFVPAVFGCVVLHELGHALMARRFGITTRDITLYPIGGVARLERMSERPWEEFWIAIAGPAVNVAIAAVLALGLFIAPAVSSYVSPIEGFAANLLYANLVLIVFNLVPAFPMDGGRVLRAVLCRWLGRLQATEIAAGLAVVLAIGMFIYGFIDSQPFLMFGALFVFFAGRQELAAVRYRQRMPNDAPLEVHGADEIASAPASPGFTGFTWDGRARVWVLWRNGRPIQTVSTE